MRKAAVLPVPVCALPATFLPAREKASDCAWMGVQYWKPRSATACKISLGRPKSTKRFLPSASGTS